MLFLYRHIEHEVLEYLGKHAKDYDIGAIMEDLELSGISLTIDQMSYEEFADILQRHDLTEN